MGVIWGREEAKYLMLEDWTTQNTLIYLTNFDL
jgi:hypothetical protein